LALGLLGFWLFGVGGFWKGKESLKEKISVGKRIAEGKLLASLRGPRL
jgi:hypothetical protein